MTEAPTLIELSNDPAEAEQQIEAIIFYLTTCGYIDSEFDLTEKAFVRKYLRTVVTARVDQQGAELSPETRFEEIERQHEHYVERFQEIDRDVKDLFTEAVADGEDVQRFVQSKLKLRCFEMFKELSENNRVALLNVAGWRDGDFSPAERLILFRYVLATNDLSAEAKVELLKEMDKPPEQIGDFWQKAKDNLSRKQLFADDAQAQEFSQTLEALVKSDGELDENEVSFVRMVRQTCGI